MKDYQHLYLKYKSKYLNLLIKGGSRMLGPSRIPISPTEEEKERIDRVIAKQDKDAKDQDFYHYNCRVKHKIIKKHRDRCEEIEKNKQK
jgi:hypothetical protein